jgi:hypothetical protein
LTQASLEQYDPVLAGALLVFNLMRMPSLPPPSTAITPVPQSGPKPDRPAGVGNTTGEAFLLKVERPVVVPPSGLIRIQDETFSIAYDELYNHRDKYYGREIELGGYVLEQEGLGTGAFLVGRDLVWCCEDDKYFIGFLARTDGDIPGPGATIYVRGALEAMEYRDEEKNKSFMVPGIKVSRIDALDGIPKTVYQDFSSP